MRTENSPSALLDEAVNEQLFGRHKPYGMPVSGYVDDVKRLTVADLMAFYGKYYAPNNAILIVAGDTTVEQVRKLAEKYYGPVAARKVEPRRRPDAGATDLPQRTIRADARVDEPRWSRHYLAPSYAKGQTQHAYALQVLAQPAGRRRDQPPVARPGGRSQARPLGLGELQPDQSRPHLVRSRRPSRIDQPDGGSRERRRRPARQADRRGCHGGGGGTGAEPAFGRRDLFAGLAWRAARAPTAPRSPSAARWPTSTPGRSASPPSPPADVVAAARVVWRPEGLVTAMLTPQAGSR